MAKIYIINALSTFPNFSDFDREKCKGFLKAIDSIPGIYSSSFIEDEYSGMNLIIQYNQKHYSETQLREIILACYDGVLSISNALNRLTLASDNAIESSFIDSEILDIKMDKTEIELETTKLDDSSKEESHGYELIFTFCCGVFLALGYGMEKLDADFSAWLPKGCYALAYLFGGYYALNESIENLRNKKFEIDTLMLVAAAGAAALGEWAEGGLLLLLFSLGHGLEHYAMGRAKRAIEALADLAPEFATVRRFGVVNDISVGQLIVGDIVLVQPNARLPADGFVVKGTTSINQAPVTGESIPVDKEPVPNPDLARSRLDSIDNSSRVFAGTINGSGGIEIEVTKQASDSTLSRVVKMVSEAETRQSSSQRFTEKFEKVFVPTVLLIVFVLLFAWVVIDESFADSFYRAMAVLVAASPCALAIATPSAVLSGIARAARGGVLIKGGAPLEELGSLKAMAFDKTGTLTEGHPSISDVMPGEKIAGNELLAITIAAESLSDHPLAKALSKDGRVLIGKYPIPVAEDLKNLIGQGISAKVGEKPVWIGKLEMFGANGIPQLGSATIDAINRLRDNGRTTLAVKYGDRDLGVIGLLDAPRPQAKEVLNRLREIGMQRMIMISGDHKVIAKAVGDQVGISEVWGDLMPEDKVEAIKNLGKETKVAMVGDGVNDAPAMAHATVGIAMGAAGSDVALETADIALMADDLKGLPFAVGLSRKTRGVILQNIVISLGVVIFLVPATIMGLGIGPAVAVHEGSTLIVVINALRLLVYKDRT